MRISERGLAELILAEGSFSRVYADSGGAPTIGVGHLLTMDERKSGQIFIGGQRYPLAPGLDDGQIRLLLMQDLLVVEECISSLTRPLLSQNEFDALVMLVFNIGREAFAHSTLMQVIAAGNFDGVPAQFRRWVYDNGKVVKGLQNRREHEIRVWEGNYTA